MPGINYWAVVAAAVAAFVASSVWYMVFGNVWLELRGIEPSAVNMTSQAWQIAGQFVRNLVVAFVLAYFLARLGVSDWQGAVQVGLWVWVGFQAMLLIGAVIHENYPFGLYAIHVGDALLQTLLMSFILGVWHR